VGEVEFVARRRALATWTFAHHKVGKASESSAKGVTAMERGSAKHGPRLDDQQKHETEGLVRGTGPAHTEEWKEPEPLPTAADEELLPPPYPPGHEPGTPAGITPEGVEARSNLARWISGVGFPTDRDALVAHTESAFAPDTVIDALRSLPDGTFGNVGQVAAALGLGIEEKRS
jgi:hypothetical protein